MALFKTLLRYIGLLIITVYLTIVIGRTLDRFEDNEQYTHVAQPVAVEDLESLPSGIVEGAVEPASSTEVLDGDGFISDSDSDQAEVAEVMEEDDWLYDHYWDEKNSLSDLSVKNLMSTWLAEIVSADEGDDIDVVMLEKQASYFGYFQSIHADFSAAVDKLIKQYGCQQCDNNDRLRGDALEKIVGVPLYRQLDDPWFYDKAGKAKFSYINPEFIARIRQGFLIKDSHYLENISIYQLYQYVGEIYFRKAYQSYHVLKNTKDLPGRISAYQKFIDSQNEPFENYVLNNFLRNEQHPKTLHWFLYDINVDGIAWDTQSFASMTAFWLRRIMDGSDEEIYWLILKFVEEFDTQWVTENGSPTVADIHYERNTMDE